jgi:carboxyl-terminal processing protease
MNLKAAPFNRSRNTTIALLAAVLIPALLAFHAGATKKQESKYYPLTIFSKVLAHIQSIYVEDVDVDKLIYGAIKGMVASLDPHSSYLTPDEFKTMQEEMEGKFGGIGIEVEYRFGRLIVISPLPESPAEKAGIRSGDEILAIDGTPTFTIAIEDAVRIMRGKPGTKVKLKMRRGEDKVYDVEIEREIIKVESVEGRLLSEDEKTALVTIKVFQEGTIDKVRSLLDQLTAKCKGNLGGLVIDIRNNPGGLLDQSIYVADEFLDKGIILTTRRASGQVLETEKAHRVGTRSGFPIVLLVSEYTASAAEVLAGALQDNGRACVVGARTFGKGSIQNIIKLPDKSALKLTTALYATPSGKIIQAEGIEPDFLVPQIPWDPSTMADSTFGEKDLAGHLEGEENATKAKPPGVPPKAFGKDYQLFMAYQVLKSKMKEKSGTKGGP